MKLPMRSRWVWVCHDLAQLVLRAVLNSNEFVYVIGEFV
jgi:hypothetical protein